MKWLAILILTGGWLLTGCQDIQEVTADIQPNTGQEPDRSAFSPLPQIDVIEVASSGEIKNENRFQTFLERVNEQEPDHIQLVQFTSEGDPISRDVQFDGSEFKSIVNSSRDSYGEGSVSEMACSGISKSETDDRIDYQLEGCGNKKVVELLVIWK
ncbi:DUF4362 domain-containing protein [Planomicrobium okeanokoites]|uniref:DUF4362 domain-containing protein n=1 Tax=Planomicrobium okeanokoites TaxID=244 RepID=UPI003562C38A